MPCSLALPKAPLEYLPIFSAAPKRIPKISRAGMPAARASATNTELISVHLPFNTPVVRIFSTSPSPQPNTELSRSIFFTIHW